MLTRLTIHDVVLIEKLALDFASGLNVLTGETGAGKSILLDALGLALGERGDAALVRAGATQASVSAAFDLPDDHPAHVLAETQGLELGNPVILRRVISRDGKSRAFVNDQPVGISLLRQFGESLLEIHGQFETHGLLNPATHRGLLDEAGNFIALRQKLKNVFTSWHAAREALHIAIKRQAEAEAEEHFLRAAVAELDELSPVAHEADQLAAQRTQLQHREKIAEALQAAEQSLNSDRGAIVGLTQAGKAVAKIADKAAGLAELLATIDRAGSEAAEAAAQLDHFMASMDAKPDALQKIEERLFALRALARKHHVGIEELPALRSDLAEKLALLTDQGGQITALTKAANTARQIYVKLAEELSAQRREAAKKLEAAITRELPPLKFERARFIVEVAHLPEDQWNADGMDRVGFLATINPGSAPGSLQKIASGGELARFMLALKVVLAAHNPTSTLVFDEVDAGIGGATASAVGERLARLAKHGQILVVTHSPQVAARATQHLRVIKKTSAKQAITDVVVLNDAARCEEIARMLSGATVTDAARQAAESLLDDAAENAAPPAAKKKARR